MTFRRVSLVLVITVLTAFLSVLPALYLYLIWPTVPPLVAAHTGSHGLADRFVSRDALWQVVWWPVLAFVVLTLFPQVHAGERLFWSNSRQRQVRAFVVGILALSILVIMHQFIQLGKNT